MFTLTDTNHLISYPYPITDALDPTVQNLKKKIFFPNEKSFIYFILLVFPYDYTSIFLIYFLKEY